VTTIDPEALFPDITPKMDKELLLKANDVGNKARAIDSLNPIMGLFLDKASQLKNLRKFPVPVLVGAGETMNPI
jgi:hypothetical protein